MREKITGEGLQIQQEVVRRLSGRSSSSEFSALVVKVQGFNRWCDGHDIESSKTKVTSFSVLVVHLLMGGIGGYWGGIGGVLVLAFNSMRVADD